MKFILQGFSDLAKAFVSIFDWTYKAPKTFKRRKIDLSKVIGRNLNDPYADQKALRQDQAKIKKDWDKIVPR